MIPILLILGAGAALELKRLASRPHGNENTQALRERERQLKGILQVGPAEPRIMPLPSYVEVGEGRKALFGSTMIQQSETCIGGLRVFVLV